MVLFHWIYIKKSKNKNFSSPGKSQLEGDGNLEVQASSGILLFPHGFFLKDYSNGRGKRQKESSSQCWLTLQMAGTAARMAEVEVLGLSSTASLGAFAGSSGAARTRTGSLIRGGSTVGLLPCPFVPLMAGLLAQLEHHFGFRTASGGSVLGTKVGALWS